jgi:hypothetical protein
MNFQWYGARAKKLIGDLETAVEAKRAESQESEDRLRQTMADASESMDYLLSQCPPAPVPIITSLQEYRALTALIEADEWSERKNRR